MVCFKTWEGCIFRMQWGVSKRRTELRLTVAILIAGCMLAASAGMQAANAATAADNQAQAAKTIAKAKAQTRVRGTIQVGRTPIKSTRKKPLIARIMAPSEGHLAGLHRGDDPRFALVGRVGGRSGHERGLVREEQARGSSHRFRTKLMTALVTVEANLPLDEELQVSQDELVRAGIRSNLRPGMEMTRGTALHLALMSSENRAAQLLGRTYPAGLHALSKR